MKKLHQALPEPPDLEPVATSFENTSPVHDFAISVENLSKSYKLYNSPIDRLKEALHPLRKKYHQDFFALRDVCFQVKKGEIVGIIGKNGSGKSTLLKILAGVLTPTSGYVAVNGKVSALLELGAGFNPELTGIENVYFNGTLMGYSHEEMNDKLDEILAFADIGEFVNQPVKVYSSGMFVRLAFAVSINVEADLLIVDEALSVGDAEFQQKCIKKMESFVGNGGTIVFVSHDPNAIKVLCGSAVLMNKGKVISCGGPEDIVNMYNYTLSHKDDVIVSHKDDEVASFTDDVAVRSGKEKISGYGNMKVEIVEAKICRESGEECHVFTSGDPARIMGVLKGHTNVDEVVVGMLIRDRFGQDVFGTNSFHLKKDISIHEGEKLFFDFSFNLDVGCGKYTVSMATHKGATHVSDNYHWCDAIASFEVVMDPGYFFTGLARLDTTLAVTKVS